MQFRAGGVPLGRGGRGVPWVLAIHTLLYYTPPFGIPVYSSLNPVYHFTIPVIVNRSGWTFRSESLHEMLLGD
jgi:hypothetical protein